MSNPQSSKSLMSTREVAMVLDMSPDTVAEFGRKGILRGQKVGRQWKFKRRDVTYLGRRLLAKS
ncbi:helix-turn-helix domain-containing protein [Thermodesulfobacteriota bacterium]